MTEKSGTQTVRHFLPETFAVKSWDDIEHYFSELLSREIDDADTLYQWLKDESELSAALEEDLAWRYIRMTCDTEDQSLSERYLYFVNEISPKIAPLEHRMERKLIGIPFINDIGIEGINIHLRSIKKSVEIFREKNIPLLTELEAESQEYGAIAAQMTIEHDGKDLTMQQAASLLRNTDRDLRHSVFEKMIQRRLKDTGRLHDLFSKLLRKRHQVAVNADFDNFRDYMFASLGRFDYTSDDCFNFHDSIRKHLLPVVKDIHLRRKKALGLDVLYPWDTEVDISGKEPLQPFRKAGELIDKSITCFSKIDPFFGECLSTMNEMGRLDLRSRKGKAPGGYNYPLHETDVPFIFMNAVGTVGDMITMMHEGGHAVHAFLCKNLPLVSFKSCPSEVAELASMSMELISMSHWDIFFHDEDELKRARRYQLEKILSILPWIATVDRFQHWIYEHPDHSIKERNENWLRILDEFSTGVVNWDEHMDAKTAMWQRQLHIYEVPFYYIEYAMSQLGAIAIWRNYIRNPEQALKAYKDAMSLGYTHNIPDIYAAAGIKFDFSDQYVGELADFVNNQLALLY